MALLWTIKYRGVNRKLCWSWSNYNCKFGLPCMSRVQWQSQQWKKMPHIFEPITAFVLPRLRLWLSMLCLGPYYGFNTNLPDISEKNYTYQKRSWAPVVEPWQWGGNCCTFGWSPIIYFFTLLLQDMTIPEFHVRN